MMSLVEPHHFNLCFRTLNKSHNCRFDNRTVNASRSAKILLPSFIYEWIFRRCNGCERVTQSSNRMIIDVGRDGDGLVLSENLSGELFNWMNRWPPNLVHCINFPACTREMESCSPSSIDFYQLSMINWQFKVIVGKQEKRIPRHCATKNSAIMFPKPPTQGCSFRSKQESLTVLSCQ